MFIEINVSNVYEFFLLRSSFSAFLVRSVLPTELFNSIYVRKKSNVF